MDTLPRSSWLVPRVGVRQGSILGPLLFVMFVNNLPIVISRHSVNMYADDTTLCNSIYCLVRGWLKCSQYKFNRQDLQT